MARPGGNPLCVGKKGRSGRKRAPVEFAKSQALIKAWNKVNENVDKEDVKDVALPLALKDMVVKADIFAKVSVQQITGTKVIKDDGINFQDQNPTAN